MRAKFQVTNLEDVVYSGDKHGEKVTLHAVYGKDGTANAAWARATPSGVITMQIDNPKAFGAVKLGGFYFVDFNETVEDESAPAPTAPTRFRSNTPPKLGAE